MSVSSLPALITKRDGRVVDFEADKISQSLFAAGESFGRPDAFLARELADGVLHFLADEGAEGNLTTARLADLVVKVVRELGQPELARSFQKGERARAKACRSAARGERDPDHRIAAWITEGKRADELLRCAGAAEMREYALRHVFSRDVVALCKDGLLALNDAGSPLELAGSVLGQPASSMGWIEAILTARGHTSGCLAIDSPEYSLSFGRHRVPHFVRELQTGLHAVDLQGVLNLNCASPPPWAGNLASGPLFTEHRVTAEPTLLRSLSEEIAACSSDNPAWNRFRIDWHLSERDFTDGGPDRLLPLAGRVMLGTGPSFVFDRRQRPLPLAEGLTRQHVSVLMTVEVHLWRLLETLGKSIDLDLYLQKLGSLARIAMSAGTQKRTELRRHSPKDSTLLRGFLLERTRMLIVPIDVDKTVRYLSGYGTSTPIGLRLAKRILGHLKTVLRLDSQTRLLDQCVDSPLVAGSLRAGDGDSAQMALSDPTATVKSQMKAAGALHAAVDGGSASIFLAKRSGATSEKIVEWLEWAWRRTALVRVQFSLDS